MTIVNASIEALKILDKPSSIEEIRKVIDDNNLYDFGAIEKNINSVVRNTIEKHSLGTNRKESRENRYFKRISPNTFIILEWENHLLNMTNIINNTFYSFKQNWKEDKKQIINLINKNKIYNEDLKTKIPDDKEYKKQKKKIKFTEYNIHKTLCQELPFYIKEKSFLAESKYKIEGSIGQGGIAEVPWICVYDKDITRKATEGYYIVYLIKSDLSGFYISLNQGWTQFENLYKIKEARIQIKETSLKARELLKSISDFSFDEIDLLSSRPLGKGYELGNICSKYYSFDSLPDDNILIDDLRNLIGIYKELKGYIGLDIIDLKNQLTEVEYQEKSQQSKRKELKAGAVKKKEKVNASNSSWVRDPDIAYTALENADFFCENDKGHITFISETTGEQFVEAHHLIPMKYQDQFEVSLDVPENIISLCPNCHRAFHNSTSKIKEELINKFYIQRIKLLSTRDINISVDELMNLY